MRQVQVSRKEALLVNTFSALPKRVKKAIVTPVNKIRMERVKKLKTPEVLVFYVTDACPLRCKHCFYWKEVDDPKKAHSLEDIEKLTKSLKEPLELLGLTGGEPFMRKDLPQIVELFVKHNNTKRIHIATNGFMPNITVDKVKEMLNVCGDARITLQFSIDGFEELHDELRGRKGSFKNVCESVKRVNAIKDNRLAVSVATVVFQKNFDQMKALKQFVNTELGVSMKVNVLRKTDSVKGVPTIGALNLYPI